MEKQSVFYMVTFPILPAEAIIFLCLSCREGSGLAGHSSMRMLNGASKAALTMLIFGRTEKHRNGFIKKADMNWWKFEKQAGPFGIEDNCNPSRHAKKPAFVNPDV